LELYFKDIVGDRGRGRGHWTDESDWRVPIDFLKSLGSLADILNTIEEGDQGVPLRERVKAIREDKEQMNLLEEEWAREQTMDHGSGDGESLDDIIIRMTRSRDLEFYEIYGR
jgi:hypothetical protein